MLLYLEEFQSKLQINRENVFPSKYFHTSVGKSAITSRDLNPNIEVAARLNAILSKHFARDPHRFNCGAVSGDWSFFMNCNLY